METPTGLKQEQSCIMYSLLQCPSVRNLDSGITCLCSPMSDTSARKLKSWGRAPLNAHSHTSAVDVGVGWDSSLEHRLEPSTGLSMWPRLPLNMMAEFQRWESQERQQAKDPFQDPALEHVCLTHKSESQVPAHIPRGRTTNPNTGRPEDKSNGNTCNEIFMGVPFWENTICHTFLSKIDQLSITLAWVSHVLFLMTLVCKAQTQNCFWLARVFL